VQAPDAEETPEGQRALRAKGPCQALALTDARRAVCAVINAEKLQTAAQLMQCQRSRAGRPLQDKA